MLNLKQQADNRSSFSMPASELFDNIPAAQVHLETFITNNSLNQQK
jgi:hypothetical protein